MKLEGKARGDGQRVYFNEWVMGLWHAYGFMFLKILDSVLYQWHCMRWILCLVWLRRILEQQHCSASTSSSWWALENTGKVHFEPLVVKTQKVSHVKALPLHNCMMKRDMSNLRDDNMTWICRSTDDFNTQCSRQHKRRDPNIGRAFLAAFIIGLRSFIL